MNVIGPPPPQTAVFRVQIRSGVWSVTRDAVFYGDYITRAAALAGACAAARVIEARGGSACVLGPPDDTPVPNLTRPRGA